MIQHANVTKAQLWRMLKHQPAMVAGNAKLKIYGHLTCTSGKRIKRHNRVFFTKEKEAVLHGYRPCGHCMRESYGNWKKNVR
jgi:methylphosphotriester-DNA--protein-cysteine methyltransferase